MSSNPISEYQDTLAHEDEGPSVDPRDVVGFIGRSARRRWPLAIGVFAGVCGITVAVNRYLPRTYHSEARIVAQGNAGVIRALSNPGKPIPDADSPTKGAGETLLKQDSLTQIVRDARLLETWNERRPPVLRLVDRVSTTLGGEESPEDKEKAIVSSLEKKFTIKAEDEALSIGLDWTDAQTAYELVAVAGKSFMDSRRAVEVAVISDAIAILEERAEADRKGLETALGEFQTAREAAKAAKLAANAPPAGKSAPGGAAALTAKFDSAGAPMAIPPGPDKDLLEHLAEKRRVIADMETTRQHHIHDVKVQLEEQRTTLGAAHPLLIASERRLETLRDEPPELIAAKNEERSLFRQVSDLEAAVTEASRPRAAAFGTSRVGSASRAGFGAGSDRERARERDFDRERERDRDRERPDEEPAVAYAHGRFDAALRKYEELMANLDAARTELDTAKAAFKYRYSIARPAELAKEATKPKPVFIFAVGLLGALFLAFLVPTAFALARGRLQERWEIEARLGLPVLGAIRLPPAS